MASVGAFNDMMGQFLTELHKTLPQDKSIKKFITSFELLKQTNPRKCVDAFVRGITPHADKISQRDESFINDLENIEFLKDLNIKEYWNGTLSDNTKNAIWQYLQTLYMLGTTITVIPQETMSMIENIAKDCADKMQDGDGGIDQDALMKTMSSMLGGMMKK
jgi:hypothetical protein